MPYKVAALKDTNKFTVVAITVTTFALAAFSVASIAMPASAMQGGNSNAAAMSNQTETKAAKDLRVALASLLQEHVTTNLAVNRALASGASQSQVDSANQAQIANANSLSAAIGSIYGDEAAASFSTLFLEHIEESNGYAAAVAAGDEQAKALANAELQEYLTDIANFFSSAIPTLPTDAVYGLLLEHETLMNQATEALVNKNFGQSKKIEQQALRQITGVANALSAGIVETQPELFQ